MATADILPGWGPGCGVGLQQQWVVCTPCGCKLGLGQGTDCKVALSQQLWNIMSPQCITRCISSSSLRKKYWASCWPRRQKLSGTHPWHCGILAAVFFGIFPSTFLTLPLPSCSPDDLPPGDPGPFHLSLPGTCTQAAPSLFLHGLGEHPLFGASL